MKMKSLVLAVATGAVMAASAIAQETAQEPVFWRIGTGGAGGTYFPIGGLIANAISNPPGARACDEGGSCGVEGLVAIAVSTNASVANMNAVNSGQLDAGLAGGLAVADGFAGTGDFEGNARDKVRAIGALYPEDLHLVLAEGLEVNSLTDLSGLRVGVGAAGSGTQVSVRAILSAFGVEAEEFELNLGQSTDRLADGQIDAFFYGGGWPFAALIQLGANKGFELYSFSPEEVEKILDTVDVYVPSTIPTGAYENITHDVSTVASPAILVTNIDQDEELIFQITQALWSDETRALLDKGHAKGKQIRLETALGGITIPLHPGAERFYREQGMIEN
ncbi:MAG TPA: TAXI family TRAP transporter solute-binding subunit [Woeseiaceae bacterium]|nr:TAXI family TRAP transporter solute-binding subunit [Woeseiaceae bacterium]